MRIQIEPSEIFTKLDGVECRVWNGITDDGTQVFVFVHRLAVRCDDHLEPFEILEERDPPRL
jgi:hypothetical protein